MPDLRIPIYRPEITVYERASKNRQWSVNGWYSKEGTITNALFYPIPDGESITEAGFRRVVEHGESPFFAILAPSGSFLGNAGGASLIARKGMPSLLYVPAGAKWEVHDAINALAYAKRGACGLELVRDRPPSPRPRPAAPPPIPVAARGPTVQLSMFD